jgi:hypothetical protein
MSTSDGYVVGSTKIVDHGPNSQRFNLVIMGDGYKASELAQFATDTDNFINTLRATDPYPDLWCGFNVFRIDVVSTDSGADDPSTCGDTSTVVSGRLTSLISSSRSLLVNLFSCFVHLRESAVLMARLA